MVVSFLEKQDDLGVVDEWTAGRVFLQRDTHVRDEMKTWISAAATQRIQLTQID